MSLQYQESLNELKELIEKTVLSELSKGQPEKLFVIKEFFQEDIKDTNRYVSNLFELITKLKKK